MIAVDDVFAVSFKSGDGPHHGTGGNDDAFGLDGLFGSVFAGDFDLAGQRQPAGAFEDGALVFLHQELDAFRVLHHDFVFALLHVGKSQLNARRLHAKISRVLHLFVHMCRLQQLLCRDATAQGARAAQAFVFLDNRYFQTQLSGANRGHIAARTAADDRYIKLFVCQSGNPL